MIHEIHPDKFSNVYLKDKPVSENDFIFHYNEKSILLKSNNGELQIPQKKDIPKLPDNAKFTFLFSFNNRSCFLVLEKPKVDDPELFYEDIYFFRTTVQEEIAWATLVGFHLMNWYSQHKFCGQCGGKTKHKNDERALICTNCKNVMYPRISPAIIVAIICNDKILLARNSNFKSGWYSVLAGFVDIGESLEETVKREVKEEVGLDVKNIRYYKSQPWPLTQSMMVGFVAEADSNQPIVIDGKEIAEANWFSRRNLPSHPPTLSISGELIEKFEKGEL